MRTYGRTQDVLTGKKTWVEVTTDANGFDDMVWLTTLAQCCKLNLGESPFWSDWGIPAYASVVTQVHPNFYMTLMQQRFSGHFMNLLMQRNDNAPDADGRPSPFYTFYVLTNYGAELFVTVPV
jgi:hypothetical protein